MQEQMSFDPHYYFGLVADNLLKNLGPNALIFADQALSKMKTIGDEEGFEMWLGIHEHLTQKAAVEFRPANTVLH